MPLILEGPDHVGKTTAAQRIVELANARARYSVFYSHMSRPPGQWDYYDDYLCRAQMFAVQDRFHYGGLVYADLRRGGTKISPNMLHLIESHLDLQGTVRIVITANPKFLEKELKARAKDEMYDASTILEANELFRKLGAREKYQTARPDFHYTIDNTKSYPSDLTLNSWIDIWFDRIGACIHFDGGKVGRRTC